jgi:hypothetical protein
MFVEKLFFRIINTHKSCIYYINRFYITCSIAWQIFGAQVLKMSKRCAKNCSGSIIMSLPVIFGFDFKLVHVKLHYAMYRSNMNANLNIVLEISIG